MDDTAKYPEGHFLGIWMAICSVVFTVIWIPIIIALGIPGLIGVGPALGVAIGLAVGLMIEGKYKSEGKIRPLTESEKRKCRGAVVVGAIIALVGCLLLLAIFLL